MILDCRNIEASMICVGTFSLTGRLMFGIVYLTMSSFLIQLIHVNPNLINSGKTNLLYVILKPKFLEPEVEVGIRN